MRLAPGIVAPEWPSQASTTKTAAAAAAVAVAVRLPESDRCDPDQGYSYRLCYTIDAAVNQVDGNGASAGFAHFGVCVRSMVTARRLEQRSLAILAWVAGDLPQNHEARWP